tara:strand:- start:66 stop:743 length:678 start_codon:yes stop_codon:yes gene_type:complete
MFCLTNLQWKKVMQSLYFNFFFLLSFFIFIINPSFSENERPSLDLNEKQKTIVDNALSSCSDVNFDDLLNTRKEKLGINEPDKSINKKKQLDNSLGIEVSRSIETIYTPEQSLVNVKKILSTINDDRLYPAIAYYIIRDFAFYENGLCKSLRNHFQTYNVYKEFYLKTKNKELDPIYENENNLNFFYKNSSNARKRILLAIQSKKRLLEKEQFLLKNLEIFINYI